MRADLTAALKARDAHRSGALRMLIAQFHNAEIEKHGALTDEEAVAQIQRAVKMRREAIAGAEQAGRADVKEHEEAELRVLQAYLPAQLSVAELEGLVTAAITEAGAKAPPDMGKVMKLLMPRLGGRADGARASALVKQKLAAS